MLKPFSRSSLDELFPTDNWEGYLHKLKSFSLVSWVTRALMIKPLPMPIPQRVSSNSYRVSRAILRSFIYFELSFVLGEKWGSNFFVCSRFPVFLASFIEMIVFLPQICIFAIFIKKSGALSYVGLRLWRLRASAVAAPCSFCYLTLYCNLKSHMACSISPFADNNFDCPESLVFTWLLMTYAALYLGF